MLSVGCLWASACVGATLEPATPRGGVLEDIVQRSALPITARFYGQETTLRAAAAVFGSASAVCLGETHDNPHHHYAQWRMLTELGSARPVAVGFEMFQTPFQSGLDAYRTHGNLSRLGVETEYDTRWGYPLPFYAPLLAWAHDANAPLLALNAPRELSKALGRNGLDGIEATLRSQLPQMDLGDPQHRAFFEDAMGMTFEQAANKGSGADDSTNSETSPHGHGGMNLEHIYAAQVLWDETMASRAHSFLAAHEEFQLVIIAGSGHCQRSAIPRRLERRGKFRAVAAKAVLRSKLQSDPREANDFDLLLVLDDRRLSSVDVSPLHD